MTQVDSWRAWFICLIAGLFPLYEFAQIDLLNSITEELRLALSLTGAELGMLSVYYNLATVAMLIPVGLLVDRFSLRKIIIFAMLVSICGGAAFAFSKTLLMASISRFITGIGGAFGFLTALKLASRWFSPGRMSFITAIYVTMMFSGGMLAQTPLILLAEWVTWRHAVLIFASCGVFIIFLNFLFVRDYPDDTYQDQNNSFRESLELSVFQSVKSAVSHSQNWLCGLYTSLLNMPIIILASLWGNQYLVKTESLTKIQAGNIIEVMFLGLIIGGPLVGWLSDKLCRRKLPMVIGAFLSVLISILIIFIHHYPLYIILILFFLLGIFSSTQIIGYPTISESNPAHSNGIAMGLGALLVMSGSLFRLLFGEILDFSAMLHGMGGALMYSGQDFKVAMVTLPVCFLISLFISFFIKEAHARKAA